MGQGVEILTHEDGDQFFAEGHVGHVEFLVGLRDELRYLGIDDEYPEVMEDDEYVRDRIRHIWVCPGPNDPDYSIRCGPHGEDLNNPSVRLADDPDEVEAVTELRL